MEIVTVYYTKKNMKATTDRINEIITTSGAVIDLNELKSNTSLAKWLDSLDLINIYLLIEEEYNIKIKGEDLSKVQTVREIVDYVNNAETED